MSRNVMSRPPRVTGRRYRTSTAGHHGTSTAGHRAVPILPRHWIPPELRHQLAGPCDLCWEIRIVQFDDQVCAECRGYRERAAAADAAQDRLIVAVELLELQDQAASR